MRPPRPFLVGLVCWLLIISGTLDGFRMMRQLGTPGFAAKLAMYPYPEPIAGTLLFGTLALFVISGIFIYEAHGWARYLYIASLLMYLVQGFLGIDYAKDPSLAWKIWLAEAVAAALSLVPLFLPQAQRYFHPPRYIDE